MKAGRKAFADVQRIVLQGRPWAFGRQVLIDFRDPSSSCPLHFLSRLLQQGWPGRAGTPAGPVQVSIGLTRRGLQRLEVPDHVLSCLALNAPAFWQGPGLRAPRHLGMSGPSAPENWFPPFQTEALHAVLSLHADAERPLNESLRCIEKLARDCGLGCRPLDKSHRLPAPAGVTPVDDRAGQWVHFGYLDGLSRVGIQGWTQPTAGGLPREMHAAGEFVLGHPQNSGADRWVANPLRQAWPEPVRRFFRNGSFGVLQQIEQDVRGFERFVRRSSVTTRLSRDEIKAKLCGRYPDGRALAAAPVAGLTDNFDYRADDRGRPCPFGSHIRRMNPRIWPEVSATLAHGSQARPLLRRGMPYGAPWQPGDKATGRGLMAQFFCAHLEDQYEHLLGEWAERVPMGSPDGGTARDPLIGTNIRPDATFEIPQAEGKPPLRLTGLSPFTRTLGVAYLLYPSWRTLCGIAQSRTWTDDDPPDSEADAPACRGMAP